MEKIKNKPSTTFNECWRLIANFCSLENHQDNFKPQRQLNAIIAKLLTGNISSTKNKTFRINLIISSYKPIPDEHFKKHFKGTSELKNH